MAIFRRVRSVVYLQWCFHRPNQNPPSHPAQWVTMWSGTQFTILASFSLTDSQLSCDDLLTAPRELGSPPSESLCNITGCHWFNFVYSDIVTKNQGCYIWTQSGTDWPHVGQIRDFFRSDFSTFWLSEPKCTKILILKCPWFVPFGDNLTPFEPKIAITARNQTVKWECMYGVCMKWECMHGVCMILRLNSTGPG